MHRITEPLTHGGMDRLPQLAPLANFALQALRQFSNTPLNSSDNFVNGQPSDVAIIPSNSTPAAAVCLVKDNSAALQYSGSEYGIQV